MPLPQVQRAVRTKGAIAAQESHSIRLDPALLCEYDGRYVFAPGVQFAISIEHDQLYA